MSTAKSNAGRPRDDRVTEALYAATLTELSLHGLEKTTVSAVATRARTSKQAVYRRFKDKTDMIAAAVENATAAMEPVAPQRGNVASDLRRCLTGMVEAFQNTDLGRALQTLIACPDISPFHRILEDIEENQRLVLRQIFIATPFEADMETRIDLLLGLVYYRVLFRKEDVTEPEIEAAIYLVLGLVAPRDPTPDSGAGSGLPGL
ncbi:TetR/AcrR family transcriptional regulator [Roseibium sp. SCP14]|uniref:TetR/AcrR family transcriptional regulator n=1 Tax=Roseibium sp. SCP14 TaxID=3141375 RepID=UPI003338895D